MYIDISFPISSKTAVYPGDPLFSITPVCSLENNDPCTVSLLSMGTHLSTHIDAPSHFIKHGNDISQITISQMCGAAKVFCIPNKSEIDLNDIKDKDICPDDIILFKTSNTDFDGENPLESYTGLSFDAAKFLASKKIKLVGIDYMTIEPATSLDFSVHKTLLSNNVLILENLCLGHVSAGTYNLLCLPLKIQGADACPVRAVLTTL